MNFLNKYIRKWTPLEETFIDSAIKKIDDNGGIDDAECTGKKLFDKKYCNLDNENRAKALSIAGLDYIFQKDSNGLVKDVTKEVFSSWITPFSEIPSRKIFTIGKREEEEGKMITLTELNPPNYLVSVMYMVKASCFVSLFQADISDNTFLYSGDHPSFQVLRL